MRRKASIPRFVLKRQANQFGLFFDGFDRGTGSSPTAMAGRCCQNGFAFRVRHRDEFPVGGRRQAGAARPTRPGCLPGQLLFQPAAKPWPPRAQASLRSGHGLRNRFPVQDRAMAAGWERPGEGVEMDAPFVARPCRPMDSCSPISSRRATVRPGRRGVGALIPAGICSNRPQRNVVPFSKRPVS